LIGLVLAAAGEGNRFGGTPKQFNLIGETPVYLRALQPFFGLVHEIVILVPAQWLSKIGAEIRHRKLENVKVTTGGPRRQDTVNKGLNELSEEVEIVLIHDAARPFVTRNLIQRVIEKARHSGACVPVLPVPDTIKEVEHGVVQRTLDRNRLYLAQTPQAFSRSLLNQAFDLARKEEWEVTDESSLLERMGETVYVIEGERSNIKITWREDLVNLRPLNDRT